jgi:hypothetical protein
MNIDLETLCQWSDAKRVSTKDGARLLRTAEATQAFWTLWRSDKLALKAAGISCAKDIKTGQWQACWWQRDIDAAIARVQSRAAVSNDYVFPVPAGLSAFAYQNAGVRYALDKQSVLIADEMGLGKTIQAIGVINADETIKRVLIVCPASLKLNWKKEIAVWQLTS